MNALFCVSVFASVYLYTNERTNECTYECRNEQYEHHYPMCMQVYCILFWGSGAIWYRYRVPFRLKQTLTVYLRDNRSFGCPYVCTYVSTNVSVTGSDSNFERVSYSRYHREREERTKKRKKQK